MLLSLFRVSFCFRGNFLSNCEYFRSTLISLQIRKKINNSNACIYVNISVLISRDSLLGGPMLHLYVACYCFYFNNPQACLGPSNLPVNRDACLMRGRLFLIYERTAAAVNASLVSSKVLKRAGRQALKSSCNY